MKPFRFAFAALLGSFLLASCTSDDAPLAPQEEVPLTFIAVAEGGSGPVQINMQTGGGSAEIVDLGAELGVSFLENGRRQIDEEGIAYFTWQEQQSAVYTKQWETGTVFRATDICGFSTENDMPKIIRSLWGNSDYSVMVYSAFPANGPPQTRVRINPRGAAQCTDLLLADAGEDGVLDALLGDGLLVLYYRAAITREPTLGLVDLATGEVMTTISASTAFQAATLRDGELLIFQTDFTFESYQTATMRFGPGGAIPGFPIQNEGLFSSSFAGDQMLVRYIYQQPSLFFSQPASYDLARGRFAAGGEPFLPGLQARMEAETGNRPLFGNFDTDLETGRSLVVYVKGDGSPEGGVVLTDFEGAVLEVIPLPLVPERVILREVQR